MTRSTAAAVLAAVAVAATAAPAVALDDLSPHPLDRAAVLAVPSVYRVEARVEVPALRTRDGRVFALPPGGRVITETGTGFAVSADGVVATVAHVAAPGGETLALAAAPLALAARGQNHSERFLRDWVRRTGARPVASRTVSLRVWPAVAEARSPEARRDAIPASLVPDGVDRDGDLALLRVPRRGIPALHLATDTALGTPVATVGFGQDLPFADTAGAPPVPTVRRGTLESFGTNDAFPGQRFTVLSSPVENGDSGGPAVDAEGWVHGVVRFRFTEAETGRVRGVVEHPSRLRDLMLRARVTNRAGASAAAFADGMSRLWALDLDGARASLTRARDAYPDHALAARELARVEEVRAAPVRLESTGWWRGAFLGVAVVAALASAGCVALLLREPRPAGTGAAPSRRPSRRSRTLD